jgi:hypothetical protein
MPRNPPFPESFDAGLLRKLPNSGLHRPGKFLSIFLDPKDEDIFFLGENFRTHVNSLLIELRYLYKGKFSWHLPIILVFPALSKRISRKTSFSEKIFTTFPKSSTHNNIKKPRWDTIEADTQ